MSFCLCGVSAFATSRAITTLTLIAVWMWFALGGPTAAQALSIADKAARSKTILEQRAMGSRTTITRGWGHQSTSNGWGQAEGQEQDDVDSGSSGQGWGQQDEMPTPAGNPDAVDMDTLLESATVFILAPRGDDLITGSGFFVAPGVVVTNAHVVDGCDDDVLVGNPAMGGFAKAAVVAATSENGRDYAILRIQGRTPRVGILRLCEDVRRMDRVSAWGFPSTVTQNDPHFAALMENEDFSEVPSVVYSEGVVSVIHDYQPRLILHTATLSHGNSGGPLVDENGDVVGINTMIHQDEDSYRQSSISLPADDLAAFLEENDINFEYAR